MFYSIESKILSRLENISKITVDEGKSSGNFDGNVNYPIWLRLIDMINL